MRVTPRRPRQPRRASRTACRRGPRSSRSSQRARREASSSIGGGRRSRPRIEIPDRPCRFGARRRGGPCRFSPERSAWTTCIRARASRSAAPRAAVLEEQFGVDRELLERAFAIAGDPEPELPRAQVRRVSRGGRLSAMRLSTRSPPAAGYRGLMEGVACVAGEEHSRQRLARAPPAARDRRSRASRSGEIEEEITPDAQSLSLRVRRGNSNSFYEAHRPRRQDLPRAAPRARWPAPDLLRNDSLRGRFAGTLAVDLSRGRGSWSRSRVHIPDSREPHATWNLGTWNLESLEAERPFRLEQSEPRLAQGGDLAADARKRRRLHVVESKPALASGRLAMASAEETRRESARKRGPAAPAALEKETSRKIAFRLRARRASPSTTRRSAACRR